MPSLKKGRKNNTLLSGRTKPDLNMTQTLKLPYRQIKVIMIKLVKSVVERVTLCMIRCVISPVNKNKRKNKKEMLLKKKMPRE